MSSINDCRENLVSVQTSFLWKIQKFSTFLKKQKPYEIRSPVLSTNNTAAQKRTHEHHAPMKNMYPRWYFDIQLNNKSSKDFISVHLNLKEFGRLKFFKVTIKFSIVNVSGNLENKFEYDHEFSKLEGFGVNEFLKKDDMIEHQSDWLPNDELRLLCEIINLNTNNIVSIPNAEDISEDFENVLDQKLLTNISDVTIIGKNKVFPAHKIILSARSPVFLQILNSMDKAEDVKIEIKDFNNDDVIEELLRFIYTGKVENITELVCDLIKAAEKYTLNELKILCMQALCKNINVQNVVKCFQLAATEHNTNLKTLAVKFMFENRRAVIETEDYKLINQNSNLHLLLADAFRILLENS